MAACSSAARKPSSTRCSRTAITPKQSSNSLAAIEAALTRISPFLCTSAAVAILVDSRESGISLKIRSKLEQMGFRIEAGVRCQQGLVLSAYRQGFGQMENAA